MYVWAYRFTVTDFTYLLSTTACVWNFEDVSDEDERNPVAYLGSRAF